MDSHEYEKWKKAGRIAAEALQYGKSLIKPGASMREVCDKVDAKIIELGARPAWPTQIGCNEVAAHYTPDPDDDAVFQDELVCLDVGAHVDGYVGDNALTVDLSGKHGKFVEAAKHAMEAAAKMVKPGASISEISNDSGNDSKPRIDSCPKSFRPRDFALGDSRQAFHSERRSEKPRHIEGRASDCD
jgi:methionyl aminopeptidase